MTSRQMGIVALGLTMLAVVAATGQNPAGSPNQEPEQTRRQSPTSADSKSETPLSFDFKGGTAEAYVAAVRKAAGDANIVTFGDLASFEVPATQLRNVTVRTAVDILRALPPVLASGQWRTVEVQSLPGSVYIVSAPAGVASKRASNELAVLEVNEILESGMKANEVLTAVEAGLSMQQEGYEPAEMRFHEATGLLFVRGHPSLTNTAERVVGQLMEKAKRSQHKTRVQQEAEAIKAQAQNLEGMVNRFREQNEVLTRQLAEFKTRAEFLEQELVQTRKDNVALERMVRTLGLDQQEKKSAQPQ